MYPQRKVRLCVRDYVVDYIWMKRIKRSTIGMSMRHEYAMCFQLGVLHKWCSHWGGSIWLLCHWKQTYRKEGLEWICIMLRWGFLWMSPIESPFCMSTHTRQRIRTVRSKKEQRGQLSVSLSLIACDRFCPRDESIVPRYHYRRGHRFWRQMGLDWVADLKNILLKLISRVAWRMLPMFILYTVCNCGWNRSTVRTIGSGFCLVNG